MLGRRSVDVLVSAAGVYGLSNSSLNKPFQKTCHGRQRFSRIVEEYNSTEQKPVLTEKLWQLMADQTRYSNTFQISCHSQLTMQDISYVL